MKQFTYKCKITPYKEFDIWRYIARVNSWTQQAGMGVGTMYKKRSKMSSVSLKKYVLR